MHVALDGRVVDDHFPGIGRYVYRLAEALAREAPDDHFTVLTCRAQADARFRLQDLTSAANLALLNVPAGVFAPSTQWQVPAALRLAQVDLFHATYWVTPWRPGVPTVLSVYDLIGLEQAGSVPSSRRWALALALRLAIRGARAILTLSEWSRRDIVARYRLAPEQVVVTPLAPDPGFGPPEPDQVAALRARLGLPERYVLNVGIDKPHKNLGTLVAAWRLVGERLAATAGAGEAPAALVLAGPRDPRYDTLQASLTSLPPEAPVRVLGRVADADLPVLLGGAAAFAFPSRYEGFGLPPLEAMACGSPVVSSNASSLPEVVGDAGLLVGPDDVEGWAAALVRLLTEPALGAELRQRGLERAAGFTWEKTAASTLGVYREMA